MLVKQSKALLAASVILASASFSVSAHDDGERFYAENPYNTIWKTSSGECWNAGTAKGTHLPECGGEKKVEKPAIKVAHDHSHDHEHSHFGAKPHTHEHSHDHGHVGGDMNHSSAANHIHAQGDVAHMHGHKMPEPTPVKEAPKPITLSAGALFDIDSAKLTDKAKAAIDVELEKVDAGSELTSNVRIVGHTDSLGAASYNQGLSERRAKSVAMYLQSHTKITDKDIETSGMGEISPVADNNTREGRAMNRRIEIFFGH